MVTKEINMNLVEQIRKIVRQASVDQVSTEIANVESMLQNGYQCARPLRPHKVQVSGEDYTACDAKVLNKTRGQTGRGNYRYLCKSKEVVGVALHRPNGNGYRRIA